jgi:hypothetical protein
LIALLMIAWGTLTCQVERTRSSRRSDVTAWSMNLVGTGLALYVFMADTIRVANQGVETLRNVLPARFNWPLFGIALLLMAAPVFQAYQQISNRTKASQSELRIA